MRLQMKPTPKSRMFGASVFVSVLLLGFVYMRLHRGSGGLASVGYEPDAVLAPGRLPPAAAPPLQLPLSADIEHGTMAEGAPGDSYSSADKQKELPAVRALVRVSRATLSEAMQAAQEETSRIAALQVASRHAGSDLRPVARELALSGSSVPLRLSAIAALGAVGGAQDLLLLDRLSVEAAKEPRLRPAADGARRRLAARGHAP